MRSVRIGSLLLLALIAACAGTKPALPVAPVQSAAPQAAAANATPSVPTPTSTPPSPPPSVVAAQTAPAALEPVARPASPSPAPAQNANAAKVAPPAKAATKVDATQAPAAQPPKKEPAAAEAAKPQAPPPLDLASLETRLKETKAIGVLTKITLKNQVDDLLSQFRAYYQGKVKTTLVELRRPFDLLILKVLSLLQDSDPTLAAAIAASREAIWGILSDPAKFATI